MAGVKIESLFIEARETYYYINGVINYTKNNYKLSYQFFINQLPIIQNNFMRARVSYNIGLCLYKINDIYQAITYTEAAQNLYISSRSWPKVAETDNLLGILHLRLNDYSSSVRHLNNALEIAERFELTTLKPLILHNFGLLVQRKGDLDEALIYINNSLELKRKTNINILVSYIVLLEILLEKKLLDLVKKNLEDAKKYCNAIIDNYHLMVIEAKMYRQLGEDDIYEKNMKEAIDYYYKNKHWKYLKEISKDFAVYYELQKKYKFSTLYYKLYSDAIISFYLP